MRIRWVPRSGREFGRLAALYGVITATPLSSTTKTTSHPGVILLVGLVKKNGIIMVDFALEAQRQRKLTPERAMVEACLVRFRPIMMTTVAAILATLPLALGVGAGAESRRPLRIAVVGGLIFSQLLTLYITPTFYVSLENFGQRQRRRRTVPS